VSDLYLCDNIGMRSQGKAKRGAGRPPTGLNEGERSTDYKRLAVRLPDDTLAALNAIGRVVDRPLWRVLADAVASYMGAVEALSERDRALVRGLLRRES
jgi:predicted transcriptional regulator